MTTVPLKKRHLHPFAVCRASRQNAFDWISMSFFPRPPKLPPRPREIATQVVKQEKSGAVDRHVLIIQKKKPDLDPPVPPKK
jgi:hypothetical protein